MQTRDAYWLLGGHVRYRGSKGSPRIRRLSDGTPHDDMRGASLTGELRSGDAALIVRRSPGHGQGEDSVTWEL